MGHCGRMTMKANALPCPDRMPVTNDRARPIRHLKFCSVQTVLAYFVGVPRTSMRMGADGLPSICAWLRQTLLQRFRSIILTGWILLRICHATTVVSGIYGFKCSALSLHAAPTFRCNQNCLRKIFNCFQHFSEVCSGDHLIVLVSGHLNDCKKA